MTRRNVGGEREVRDKNFCCKIAYLWFFNLVEFLIRRWGPKFGLPHADRSWWEYLYCLSFSFRKFYGRFISTNLLVIKFWLTAVSCAYVYSYACALWLFKTDTQVLPIFECQCDFILRLRAANFCILIFLSRDKRSHIYIHRVSTAQPSGF